jgi:hypothetical protein
MQVKDISRDACIWDIKAASVHLVDTPGSASRPTDRKHWLVVARDPATVETKYFVSNAAGGADRKEMLQAAFAR